MGHRHTRRWKMVAAGLCAGLSSAMPPGQDEATGNNVVRIESEYKLSVPDDEAESVWAYLESRYEPGSEDFLLDDAPGRFATSTSRELFIDTYYDAPGLALLRSEGGVRYRRRYFPDNPDAEKHGRELVQLKLSSFGSGELNRAEIKFAVKHYTSKKDAHDLHPLLGLVKRGERGGLIARLGEVGIDAEDVKPALTLTQVRRRVYIARDETAFATITLDDVSASKWWATANFYELELELNEIGYTEGTDEERAFMSSVNARMKADLLERFPTLVQDQTPKYNKAFDALDGRLMMFPIAVRLGMPVEALALGLLTLGAGGLFLLMQHRRRLRAERAPWAPEPIRRSAGQASRPGSGQVLR